MDPASRTLQRVAIDDAATLNTEQTFSDLMGDKVEPRKEFIERHAATSASSMSRGDCGWP